MEEINTNQKLEVVETNEIERNIQEQKTIIPISQAMQEEKALTLKDFGGDVDKLYIAHEKGENVKLPNWLKETEKGIEIMPQLLFQHIIENEHILSVKSDNSDSIELYRYDKRGFYKKWGASECKPYIKSFLPTRIRNPYHWKKIFEELKTEFPNTEVSELNADENIINFQNGILDLTTGELLPHSPKYLTTIQIQCNYKPNLPLAKAPITQRFLIDLTGGNVDDIATILEAIGIINSNIPAWKFKKLIILQGKGNTGKSVLREVVTDIVGEENTFTIDMAQLNSRFGASGIDGKRMVGSGDLKFQQLSEIDRIKELTGGDRINAEAKFKNSYTLQFNGLLWWNTNDLPNFSGDKGEHVFDRFLILSCDNVIPEEKRDPELRRKILEEREVIVSQSVAFLIEAIKRGYKFTESERAIKNREDYERRMNSLKYFLKECCEIGTGRTNTAEFKRRYYKWCEEKELTPERPNNISRMLKNDFDVNKIKSNYEFYELTIKPNQERKQ